VTEEPRSLELLDEVVVDPARARVYCEGWQSWSPATWYPVEATGLRPDHEWQHQMRFRPGTPVADGVLQAEGLLVVDPGTGAPARRYATSDLVTVPTLYAELRGRTVVVRGNGPVDCDVDAAGGESALAAYGDRIGVAPLGPPPRVWCSWYRYFEDVAAGDVAENLRAFDEHGLSVDVVQVDDGWSPGLGEGLRPADRFGDLPELVHQIRASGRRAGIWLAPFLVGHRTTLAMDHPDWLVGAAGRNWGQELVGLDLTHPGVRDLLAESLRGLVRLGVDYLKLDFLYAGAVPGARHDGSDPVAAYRSGLALVREVVGPDVILVGCGAPLLPSVGLVDAMRVSPDTFHEGGEDGSTGLRGLRPLAARAWQQGRLWVNDPDCLVARPTYSQRERWAEAARAYGGLRSFSDRVAELDARGLDLVRTLLADGGSAAPLAGSVLEDGARLTMAEPR
jgi:alpha-galactosidase